MRKILLPVVSLLLLSSGAVLAQSPEDEEAVRALLASYVMSWNRHDMRAFAQLFTPECDYIVVTGKQLRGRQEIYTYHQEIHRGLFRDRQLQAEWKDLRYSGDGVAIGHVEFKASGPSSDGRGNTTALATVVLMRRDGKWLIDALHNTLLSAEGGSVTPVGGR